MLRLPLKTSDPTPLEDEYEIHIEEDVSDLARRWDEQVQSCAATVFQTGAWLQSWYSTVGRSAGKPMLVSVFHRGSRELAVKFPLVRVSRMGLKIVRFPDAGLSDYNAPVLGPAAPQNSNGARCMWLNICKALQGVDLIELRKMPAEIEGRVNPLSLLKEVRACLAPTLLLNLPDLWETYIRGLERTFRKELGRSWRVFSKHDGALFRRISCKNEATRIVTEMSRQQRRRFSEANIPYGLGTPEITAFYHSIVINGIKNGTAVLTALMKDKEIVSALLGLSRGETFVMIRISIGDRKWSNCSPGRLVIVQTMKMLHEEGYRKFDFSNGDYAYKRRLGARSVALFDATTAISSRGWPMVAYQQVKQAVKRYPAIHSIARQMIRARKT